MNKESIIYFDNNATTPLDPAVIKVMQEMMLKFMGNPSSQHIYGQQARGILVRSRKIISEYLGVKPTEIIFTSGATEGMNMILRGYLSLYPNGHVITSDLEHACVYQTLMQYEKEGGEVTFLHPGLSGAPSPDQVSMAIRPDTKLIALMAVNNETGMRTEWEEIAKIALDYGIPFVVDGVALLGKEEFTIPEGVSAMSFTGHKIHAPQGVGFSYIKKTLQLRPILTGGFQEYGRRAGTENLLGIVALAEAISILNNQIKEAQKRMTALRDRLESGLLDVLPDIKIVGSGRRVCNTTMITFPGVEGETLLALLDQEGIATSHGSACMSGGLEPSRVLLNMDIPRDLVKSSLRFSLSRMTTATEIEKAIEIIPHIFS